MTFAYGDYIVIKVAKQELGLDQAVQMNEEDAKFVKDISNLNLNC